MIIVTGAAGFIGSNLVRALNARGERDILAVDNLSRAEKFRNLADCEIADYLDKDELPALLASLPRAGGRVRAVLHQGACSDTMETDGRYMMRNNYRYSAQLLEWALERRVPLLYASSAAVYGGSTRFVETPDCERPLNVYGYSKLLFDQVVRRHLSQAPSQVVGLRYFNVYGPRESHKGRMASVAFHNTREFAAHGRVELFEGWDGWPDGGQQRDFIHVDDVVAVNLWFLDHPDRCGIFNCGTGRAQTFNEVAQTVVGTMRALRGEPAVAPERMAGAGLVRYKTFPDALKGKYQSFTQADTTKLREAGYDAAFATVQQGVDRYVRTLATQAG